MIRIYYGEHAKWKESDFVKVQESNSWTSEERSSEGSLVRKIRVSLRAIRDSLYWQRVVLNTMLGTIKEESKMFKMISVFTISLTLILCVSYCANAQDDQQSKPIQTYRHGGGRPIAVAVSQDGRFLLTRCGNVTVWNTASEAEVTRVEKSGRMISSAAFSYDAKHFVTGDQYGWLTVYETQSGQKTFDVFVPPRDPHIGHPMPVGILGVAFSPHGDKIAALRDFCLVVYDLTSKEEIVRVNVGSLRHYVVFFPDGRRVLARGSDSRAWDIGIVVDCSTGDVVRTFEGARATLVKSDKEVVTITGHLDSSRRYGTYVALRWDANTGELKSTSPQFTSSGGVFSFSPSGDMVFVKEKSRTIGKVVDLQTGATLRRFDPPGDEEIGVKSCFWPDGTRLVTVSGDTAYLWDISDLVTAVENAALYDQKK